MSHGAAPSDMKTETQAPSGHVGSGELLGIPRLELRGGSPGEIFIVDECGHVVANFRAKTPDCHKAPYAGRDNFDAGINMDAAKWLIAEMRRRWETPSYARFLGPNASHEP